MSQQVWRPAPGDPSSVLLTSEAVRDAKTGIFRQHTEGTNEGWSHERGPREGVSAGGEGGLSPPGLRGPKALARSMKCVGDVCVCE